MVTDIHDWSMADAEQAHPVFSVQVTQAVSDSDITTHDHEQQCGVCSYDHGGHLGQTLAAAFYRAGGIFSPTVIKSPHAINFWHSRNTSPEFRPPIV